MAGESDKNIKAGSKLASLGVESNLTPSKTIDIDINKIVTITKSNC